MYLQFELQRTELEVTEESLLFALITMALTVVASALLT